MTLTGLPLFDLPPRSRRDDPSTSHDAAQHAGVFVTQHHRAILQAMRAAGRPMAAKEIADAVGWPSHHAANRRTAELERAGLIEIAPGDFYTNPSGRKARRYRLR